MSDRLPGDVLGDTTAEGGWWLQAVPWLDHWGFWEWLVVILSETGEFPCGNTSCILSASFVFDLHKGGGVQGVAAWPHVSNI